MEYYQLADRLIEATEKDALAEVARILSVHVAHYQGKHGKVPLEETLRLLHADTLTDAEVAVAADAMEFLTAVIGVAWGLVADAGESH